MNADSEREREDLGYLSTLEGKPMTSGSRPQETRPGNYPKKELYVCWERAATSKKCFLNHKNIPAQFINT